MGASMTMQRIVRTSQPQGSVGIDYSNPLSKGVTGLWNLNTKNVVDAVSGVAVSVNDSANVVMKLSRSGIGPASISSTQGRYINTNRTLAQLGIGGSSNRTIFGVASFDSTSLDSPIFVTGVPSTGNQDWSLRKISTGGGNWRFNIFGVIAIDFTYALNANDPVVFVCTQKGTAVEIWINGSLRGSSTATINTNASNLYFLSDPVSTVWNSYQSPIHQIGTANVAWGSAEKLSFFSNPWQLFAPITRPIWVPVSSTVVSISRPTADVFRTGWTGTPDNTNLYTDINETTFDDASYITSPTITGGEYTTYDFLPTQAAGNIDVRFRAWFTGSSAQARIHLLDGSGTLLGTSAWQTVTSTVNPYTASLTTTGISSRVKIEVQ
jgi:hypothetical protein